MRKSTMLLSATALFFAGMCAFETCMLADISARNKATVHAYCGAYDVAVTGHDAESRSDAVYALLRVVHDERNDCSLVK